MRRNFTLFFLSLFIIHNSNGQTVKESFNDLSELQYGKVKSLSFSVLDENIAIPFTDMFKSPNHIGFMFSYEVTKKRRPIYSFVNSFQLGYYKHHYFHHNIFGLWKPRFQWSAYNKLRFALFPGIGYSHTFPVQETFVLKDGIYQKEKNRGKPHGMMTVGSGLYYVINRKKQRPTELFVNYELAVLFPYAPNGTLPFYPTTLLSVGIKLQLTNQLKNETKN